VSQTEITAELTGLALSLSLCHPPSLSLSPSLSISHSLSVSLCHSLSLPGITAQTQAAARYEWQVLPSGLRVEG